MSEKVVSIRFLCKAIGYSRQVLCGCLEFFYGQPANEYHYRQASLPSHTCCIDSFPAAVCHNIRIPQCRIVKGKEYSGYNASRRIYFYGFKVHVVVTADGIPVEYTFTTGNKHDLDGIRQMPLNLPQGSEIMADSAYTGYEPEDMLADNDIRLWAVRKKDSKHHPLATVVTFTSAKNPALYNTSSASATDGYHLVANPSVINVSQPDPVESGGAEAFYGYDYATKTFTLLDETAAFTLKPFEASVKVKNVTPPLYENIGGETPAGLESIDAGDPVMDVRYYDLQGRELQRLSGKGVYIVKKIHASQKVEIEKVFYKN